MVRQTTERLPVEDVVVEQIRRAFRVSGGAFTLDQNRAGLLVSTWRQLARCVARELDRRVETVANGDHAWAVLRTGREDRSRRNSTSVASVER